MPRKELPESCDGSVFCPVPGHVGEKESGAFIRHAHIPLTDGQRRTLLDRRRAAREAEKEVSA